MLENLNIKITNQMLSIIAEIDEFKGSWKLLGQMAPEKLQALKKLQQLKALVLQIELKGINFLINRLKNCFQE